MKTNACHMLKIMLIRVLAFPVVLNCRNSGTFTGDIYYELYSDAHTKGFQDGSWSPGVIYFDDLVSIGNASVVGTPGGLTPITGWYLGEPPPPGYGPEVPTLIGNSSVKVRIP